ncbi:uncharacterized protein LOC129957639 isoform X1 [Argiope bruennichi]|uniref:uncharacterized protein LOC129957639 isoform X1 n=2 Tax=Argiope bruennichi TaxID=94029 RepID=UPI002494B5D2|nr:uncharacterized protein LOC129957639 isoform X1 [Argiope bruennichi]
MSDESDDERSLLITDMNEGMVEMFNSFIANKDYEEALQFVSGCFGFVPTPFVINKIIFTIMMNCDESLAEEAEDYLEGVLRIMTTHDKKSNIIEGLSYQSDRNSKVWDTFSHLVESSLYHLKILETCHDRKEYVKNPNCKILVNIFVKAFINCPLKSDILGSHAEKRLSSVLRWINQFYKYNIQHEPLLNYLHEFLDYIIDSEVSGDPSLPACVKIHSANLSQYMFLILNFCKDVFSSTQNQQRFFNNSKSLYLITKVCHYRLHELIEMEALPQDPGMLTLKSIVENYFFHTSKKKSEDTKQTSSKSPIKSDSPRKSIRVKKLKKFSKEPIPGDTDLHECCRLGRPADLLTALYGNKKKDINVKNSAGNTPLHEACLASSYLCSKFLIEEAGDRTIDYRATDNEGRTPLHCAVYVNAFDIVNLLLNRAGNALVKCPDNWGKTPIDYSTTDEMRTMLQKVESKLQDHNQDDSKLPSLKNSQDYHLYLRTLKTLVSSYFQIYDLPKVETSIKTLSHDRKKCYHYKAESNTMCLEDSSILDTFGKVVNKFISCAEVVAKEENAKMELKLWQTFAAAFK